MFTAPTAKLASIEITAQFAKLPQPVKLLNGLLEKKILPLNMAIIS
jgi:hypothetical protein